MSLKFIEHIEREIGLVSRTNEYGEEVIEEEDVRKLIASALNNERRWLGDRYVELSNEYGEYDTGRPSCEFIFDRIGLEAK